MKIYSKQVDVSSYLYVNKDISIDDDSFKVIHTHFLKQLNIFSYADNEINNLIEKDHIVGEDVFMIEDSEDGFSKKKIRYKTLKKYVPVKITSLSYNITDSGLYIVDTNDYDISIILPSSGSSDIGYKITIKNIGIHQVIIQCQGTDKIDGASTYSLVSQYESVTIYDNLDGNFYIV